MYCALAGGSQAPAAKAVSDMLAGQAEISALPCAQGCESTVVGAVARMDV